MRLLPDAPQYLIAPKKLKVNNRGFMKIIGGVLSFFIWACLLHANDAPKQVALKEATGFITDLGQVKATVKLPEGAMVDVSQVAGGLIWLKKGNATAKMRVEQTDFQERLDANRAERENQEAAARQAEQARLEAEAAEARQKEEAAEAKRKDLIDRAGPKPVVSISPLDGSVTIPSAMTRGIKERLKDPDSFQPRKVLDFGIYEKDGIACWIIQIAYAAKNSFGGYTLGTATAYMRGSTLLALELGKD
jgi:hypothetical protein